VWRQHSAKAANAGANNHHLVGRGAATVEIEDDRFGHWPVALDFERPVARWQAKRKEQRIERVEWQEKLRLRHVFSSISRTFNLALHN